MSNAIVQVPFPQNEPIYDYEPGSSRRDSLKERLDALAAETVDIPCIIGGREVRTGNTAPCVMPHDHGHVLGQFHQPGEKEVAAAIEASTLAWREWSRMPWEDRAAVFLKMASLLAGSHRDTINAATMLGLSKNVFQAEIDAACELIDFWNFNAFYAQGIYAAQPPHSPPGMWNQVENRPLEGFVFAVTPFNFTSIAANLPTAPVLMGNVALWKPSANAVYPTWFLMQLFREAGLPDGVINYLPGRGAQIGPQAMAHPDLAGIHFTGSTATFQSMWQTVGANIKNYRSYPRIVGETGGKDFIIAHESADVEAVATAILRGAFEYQGQKCSAVSRVYIPSNIWDEVRERYVPGVAGLKMGDVRDFGNFMNAVIDERAFKKITGYIDAAKADEEAQVITGGGYDDSQGWFIEPTTILTANPKYRTMCEEIFGPVVTIHVYDPAQWSQTLELVDGTSPYALTGAVFATEREAVLEARVALTHAAGNYYINDKPTGAVVGQQPFGGGRASGTNDKAGSPLNLLRWTSQRTVKENFIPPKDYRYPFMGAE
ncbi:MAG: L-glutamate gamma-semialdehyde dehydrogenase [Verrucomicrobiota bacterium]|nr:L-glutamate gamma-semialdehyde dehydrogenase [Verrucomicrobiota bacterium]